MKLLGSGFTTAETTFAGTTAGGSSGAAGEGFRIQRVTAFCGGTTVAANSSGGIKLVVGRSSVNPQSTYVVLPTPKSGDATSGVSAAALSVTLDDLDIRANWFEFQSNEAANGGWGAFAFGE